MLQFDEYKVKLNNLRPELDELDQALGLETAIREVEMLESESASDGFWDNLEKAQKVQQRVKQLRDKIEGQQRRKTQWDDLMTLCELGNEAEDETLVPEVEEGFAKLEAEIEEAKLSTLLTGEYDGSNAILTFHAGAGGTEAQDWAQMLFRMYTRWAERHGYVCKTLDYLDGDEAGLKSATISIEGENAYGHLKSEHGVHRLVRVSPFDANARRQTSFAALEVMPEIPDDVEVDIRPEDVEMQVFRSSGAGGQQDFVMGAYLSKGGKSFICCSSSYMDKKSGQLKSRIRPTLLEGSVVTATRTNLHYVVTEYGKFNAKGKSTWERAEGLIAIAHPQFREELIAEAEKMHIWRRSNKR